MMPPMPAVRRLECLCFDPTTAASTAKCVGLLRWDNRAASCAPKVALAWTMKLEGKVWNPTSVDYILVKDLKLEVHEESPIFYMKEPKPMPKKAANAPGPGEAGEDPGEPGVPGEEDRFLSMCIHMFMMFASMNGLDVPMHWDPI